MKNESPIYPDTADTATMRFFTAASAAVFRGPSLRVMSWAYANDNLSTTRTQVSTFACDRSQELSSRCSADMFYVSSQLPDDRRPLHLVLREELGKVLPQRLRLGQKIPVTVFAAYIGSSGNTGNRCSSAQHDNE